MRILQFDGKPNLYAYLVSLPVGTVVVARYRNGYYPSWDWRSMDDEMYQVYQEETGKKFIKRFETGQKRVLKNTAAIRRLFRKPEKLFVYDGSQGQYVLTEEIDCV